MATSITELFDKIVDKTGFGTVTFLSWAKQVFTICYAVQEGGTTADRPSGSKAILFLYRPYFDTTLGKPIWLKSTGPSVWVDATGASV